MNFSVKHSSIALVVTCSLLSGCATMTPAQQAASECGLKGAGIGLLSGAALGALSAAATGGNVAKAAAIGAGTGAIVGGVGNSIYCYMSASRQTEVVKDYNATKAELNYDASQGDIVKVTNFVISPTVVTAGSPTKMSYSYLVMTPENNELTVTKKFTLEKVLETNKTQLVEKQVPKKVKVKNKWKTVMTTVTEEVVAKEKAYSVITLNQPLEYPATIKPNTYSDSESLPTNLLPTPTQGSYRVTFSVRYGTKTDTMQQEFTVQ